MSRLVFPALVAAAVALLSWTAAPAHAGSDSPVPYSVTADGLTLPAGVTFADGGHVNWRTNLGSHGIHFEVLNNQPSGVYIGQSFLPFDLAPGECVIWVQVWLYQEHYGEAGQPPICNGGTSSTTEPSPSPSPTATATPTSTPLPTSSPEPSVTPSPNSTPTSPSLPISPSANPAVPASSASADTTAATGSIKLPGSVATARLADTGASVPVEALALGAAPIVLGLMLLRIFRRDLETGPATDSPYTLRKTR